MQTIDFIKGIGYEVISFPDGEKHLKIKELDRKDTVGITCRITNSDDLFLLMQLSDILKRQCVVVERINIPYLMTMRCDRLFSFNEAFSLRIVADIINSFNANEVCILEAHSQITHNLIKNSTCYDEFYTRIPQSGWCFCFPDKGAKERYYNDGSYKPILCEKVRDVTTGALSGFKIVDLGNYKEGDNILVVDDLCDGGGTFIGIAKELRKLNPKKLCLKVTHAVQRKGIENVAKVYDEVYITNSYKDWDNLPNNVIMDNYNEII